MSLAMRDKMIGDMRHQIDELRRKAGIRSGVVKYLTLAAMRRTRLAIRDLPFWERYPFEHEREFRIIYESHEMVKSSIPTALTNPFIFNRNYRGPRFRGQAVVP